MLQEWLIDSEWEWADDAKSLALFAGLIERRGRFFGTEAALAAAVGITTRQVRRALDRLRKKYIETRRRSRGLVVTVKRLAYWQKMAAAAVKSGQSETLKNGQTEASKYGQTVVKHGSNSGQSLNIDSLNNYLSLKELKNPPLPPATENLVNRDAVNRKPCNLVNHDPMTEAWAKLETAIAALGEALTAIRALRQTTGVEASEAKERLTAVKERPPRRQKEKTTESVASAVIGEIPAELRPQENKGLPTYLRTAISGIAKSISLSLSDAVLTRLAQQTPEFIGNWLDAEKDRRRGVNIGVPLAVAQWRTDNGVSPRAETMREVKRALSPPPPVPPPKPVAKANCVYCEGSGWIVPGTACECVGGEHRELAEVRRLQEERRVSIAAVCAQAKRALAAGSDSRVIRGRTTNVKTLLSAAC
ncbi:hypothetical protein AGMMS49959_07370 [Planctomycetales bacterium]|nr:hypothetical protein AGMMS49959_07370 [Planctomycetales bacterium]